MDLGLADKAVMVTGGSNGIGLETARLFAHEGARVLICTRRESALAEAAAAASSLYAVYAGTRGVQTP